ncbi:hypothetical protein APHAL10511_007122 [Amanita phalloides]|nr:hypothetical protein APHAL10511_007122 [Amanita phalloides]
MNIEPDSRKRRALGEGDVVAQPSLLPLNGDEADDEIYGASHFGRFGQYMRRKRAKLQIQNAAIAQGEHDSHIFHGLSIYINGWTDPSVQDLREMILRNGGIYQPYLDKKSLVTHVITCSLTPAKLREFKNMKVVLPQWIVDSVNQMKLLPWQNYKYSQQSQIVNAQGNQVEQRTLESFGAASSSKAEIMGALQTVNTTTQVHVQNESVEITAPIPYAADPSNFIAQKALANPDWRRAHTSAGPDFIEGYYRNSRLHYLSTWKAELRTLVAEAQERADQVVAAETNEIVTKEPDTLNATSRPSNLSMRNVNIGILRSPSKKRSPLAMAEPAAPEDQTKNRIPDIFKSMQERTDEHVQRIIMHCDFDSFFVAVGLTSRPHLRGKPIVVCHSQGTQGGVSSTSEVASSSYEARKQGVRNGMSLQQARKLCPKVMTMPYEFERYRQTSLQFYSILLQYADDVQAVSVDEALIDVTTAVRELSHKHSSSVSELLERDIAKELAEDMRAQVRDATGCEVSIGISYNILLARLATRRAKPAGSFHIPSMSNDVIEYLSTLDITDLPGFGHAAKDKALGRLGSSNVAKLREFSKDRLCEVFGRTNGETLWGFVRGTDHRLLERDGGRRSVSCEISYGIRFMDNAEAERFICQVAKEVRKRLDEAGMLGRLITLKVLKRSPSAPIEPPKFLGCGKCDSFTKQAPLVGPGGQATSDDQVITQHSLRLFRSFRFDPQELRGIGIQIQRLETNRTESPVCGQTILPFLKTKSSLSRSQTSVMMAEPPANEQEEDRISPVGAFAKNFSLDEAKEVVKHRPELPSFSQVDQSVYDALPDDVKEELSAEFRRHSEQSSIAGPSKPKSILDSPRKDRYQTLKRLTRQLSPKTVRSNLSPNKSDYQSTKSKASMIHVTESELHTLGLHPDVFYFLPEEIQREQLVRARLLKEGIDGLDEQTQKKVLKPRKPPSLPAEQRRHLSPPRAKFRQPLCLRQHSTQGGRHHLTETSEIQTAMGNWVERHRRWAPNEKDVKFFAKYLVQCVNNTATGDDGVEKATAVMKWWMVLLRRYWGDYGMVETHASGGPQVNLVGEAWWRAFKGVKEQLDREVRRKFGGSISLK